MQTIRCRIIVSDWEDDGPGEVSANDIGRKGVFVYEYDAPIGWETEVGRGVLFMGEWSDVDTSTAVQVRLGEEWVDLGRRQGAEELRQQVLGEALSILPLKWWEEKLMALGIVRDRDRLLSGINDPSKIALDLGGKFFEYDKKVLHDLVMGTLKNE